jgi:hypothetical protein
MNSHIFKIQLHFKLITNISHQNGIFQHWNCLKFNDHISEKYTTVLLLFSEKMKNIYSKLHNQKLSKQP